MSIFRKVYLFLNASTSIKDTQMKTVLISTIIALGIASTAFRAHGDPKRGNSEGQHADHHASAAGKPGDSSKVSRTVTVEMSDTMRFMPANINVKRGETVKFVAKNIGKIKHEMVLGTTKELKEHAEMMRKMPGMEHDDSNQVSVEAGKSGEFVWQFNKAGTFDFACLEPGHFEAGMVGKVIVAKAPVNK